MFENLLRLRKQTISVEQAASILSKAQAKSAAVLDMVDECRKAFGAALIDAHAKGGADPEREKKALEYAEAEARLAAMSLEAALAISKSADEADAVRREKEHLAAVD